MQKGLVSFTIRRVIQRCLGKSDFLTSLVNEVKAHEINASIVMICLVSEYVITLTVSGFNKLVTRLGVYLIK